MERGFRLRGLSLLVFLASGVIAAERAAPFLLHGVAKDLSEGVSVFDVDRDGKLDVVSGAYWYRAPHWDPTRFREVGFTNEYMVNCGEFAVDVNGDGYEDLLSAGWQEDGIYYYENPKRLGVMWPKRKIAASKDTEGLAMADVDGDGVKDLLVSNYSRQPLLWIRLVPGRDFEVHVVQASGQGNGHGVGFGDVDGDGKGDIVTERGWFRQVDWRKDAWEYRAEFLLHDASIEILVRDVNADGKADLIFGRGHALGLFWLEQKGGGKWEQHLIDGSFTQVHTVALADLDGDGKEELLAGKRYRAHNEKDPGAFEPLAFYYYRFTPGREVKFERETLAFNSPGSPGMQMVIRDLDGDGDVDIVTASKSGQYWFENLKINRVPDTERETLYQRFPTRK
jgi:hypothetical protein